MKDIVVFGMGDYSDILTFIIEKKMQRKIAAYTANRVFIDRDEHHGKPVVAFEEIEEHFSPMDYEMVLSFGSAEMMTKKSNAFQAAKEKGYTLANVIHPDASVDTVQMGEGNIVFSLVAIESHCQIGDGNIFWPGCVLPHHNVIGNFNSFSPGVTFSGYASVEDHTFIGSNSSVKNKVKIGSYVYVGAGSYVRHDLSDHQVFVPQRGKVLEGKTGFDFL